jgi:hypothetical protein
VCGRDAEIAREQSERRVFRGSSFDGEVERARFGTRDALVHRLDSLRDTAGHRWWLGSRRLVRCSRWRHLVRSTGVDRPFAGNDRRSRLLLR